MLLGSGPLLRAQVFYTWALGAYAPPFPLRYSMGIWVSCLCVQATPNLLPFPLLQSSLCGDPVIVLYDCTMVPPYEYSCGDPYVRCINNKNERGCCGHHRAQCSACDAR